MFFVSFTKGPGGFPYVLIITAKVPTLIPIDGITLVDHRVFVLSGDQEVLDGAANFEVSLDAIPTTDHKFILENNGIEVLRLFRDWERLQCRECNYKNHRILTLRCLHNDLVPVSIKLKSSLRTERARKILGSAEKKLLQARLKSINSLLDNNAKQIGLTRSQIASILPTPSYSKCQEFIEKVKELRFKKVKDRQVRKFNNLLNKKEGNITWQSSPHRQVTLAAGASPQAANRQATLATRASPHAAISSQAGRQLHSATRASLQATGRQATPATKVSPLVALSGIKFTGRQASNPSC